MRSVDDPEKVKEYDRLVAELYKEEANRRQTASERQRSGQEEQKWPTDLNETMQSFLRTLVHSAPWSSVAEADESKPPSVVPVASADLDRLSEPTHAVKASASK